MKTIFTFVALFIYSVLPSISQYEPGVNNNVTLLSHWDNYSVYSNIWGWTDANGREYVLIGHDQGTSVIDVTNPNSPSEITMIPGPHPTSGTIWRELKTYSHYAYIVSEHTLPNNLSGVQIVDLSYLPDSVHYVQSYRWPSVTASNAHAHSLSVDDQEPYLYIQGGTSTFGIIGGNQGGLRILSLADPENPTSVGVLATRYVHDSYTRNGILFASNINNNGHVDIWSLASRSNPHLITQLIYPNGFSHNSGISDNNNFLYTTDEITGATVKTWDISVLWDNDSSNNSFIELKSEYIGNRSQIAHNIHINGSYAYLSHYAEGVKVLDLNNPAEPVEVGYYDTHLPPDNGFVGDWGVYPHFPSGTFVVSDIEAGLYVFRFDTVAWGGIRGIVKDGQSGDSLDNAHVFFLEANKEIVSDSTGEYHLKTNAGMHHLVVSRIGFFPETLEVQLSAHEISNVNISLESENAFISLDKDSIGTSLSFGENGSRELQISNLGSGILHYSLRDINGHQNGKNKIAAKNNNTWKILANSLSKTPLKVEQQILNNVSKAELKLLAVDSLGDVIGESTNPDIKAIYGEKSQTSITLKMQLFHPVNQDSLTFGYSIDADQDPTTGAQGIGIYQGDLGAEYDVFATVPAISNFGIPAKSVLVFNNVTGGNPSIFPNAVQLGNDSSVTITISLSSLGNDDGNMNFVSSAYYWGDSLGSNPPTSSDVTPEKGHLSLGYDPYGDVPWLSLSTTDDTIQGQHSHSVSLLFDATVIPNIDSLYHGVVLVQSNDPNTPEIQLPISFQVTHVVGVGELQNYTPQKFSLEQNYPNPFNPITQLSFSISSPTFVTLKVYDIIGNELATLVNERKEIGKYSIAWNGEQFPSGMYFYRLKAGEFSDTKKLIILK